MSQCRGRTLVAQCVPELPPREEASLWAFGREGGLPIWSGWTRCEHGGLHLSGWSSWQTRCGSYFGGWEGSHRMSWAHWALWTSTMERSVQVCHQGDAITGCGEAYEADVNKASWDWLDWCAGVGAATVLAFRRWPKPTSKASSRSAIYAQ